MATEYDLALFEQHHQSALELPVAPRWSLERSDLPLEVFCTMHPRTAPHEHYKVRLRWTDYSKPPSVRYVNPADGNDTDPRAWPNIEGSRPSHFFICAPFTKEGNDHHAEWASSTVGYKVPEEPLPYVLQVLQHLLDNTYTGRGGT